MILATARDFVCECNLMHYCTMFERLKDVLRLFLNQYYQSEEFGLVKLNAYNTE